MTVAALARLDDGMRRLESPTTAQVRVVRRALSRDLKTSAARDVLALADQLLARDDGFDRFIAYELIAAHPAAMASVGQTTLRRLGRGMDSWGDVDTFACYVAGPAWREGLLSDDEIAQWARSSDRWWRRAALVSTVALNCRARGGAGDVRRTLAVCELAIGDSDPMVVKAMSWALRELARRAPEQVEQFVARHESELAPLIRREVRSKLTTGLKSPRRRGGGS